MYAESGISFLRTASHILSLSCFDDWSFDFRLLYLLDSGGFIYVFEDEPAREGNCILFDLLSEFAIREAF